MAHRRPSIEQHHREVEKFLRLATDDKAMLRSQSGLGAGAALSCDVFRFAPHLFRVLLLRRLRLPLPPISRTCRCGRPLYAFAHHRAACCWGRGFALESAGAKICGESDGPSCPLMFSIHDVWRSFDEGLPLGVPNSRLTLICRCASLPRNCQTVEAQPGMAPQWWCLVAERKLLIQILWSVEQSQVGRFGTGSWRQVVQRDCHVIDVAGSR